MELPPVEHFVRDDAAKIEYVVCAYRELTDIEIRRSVQAFVATHRKRLRPNCRYTILTKIGRRE
jgi:hypothetical protein